MSSSAHLQQAAKYLCSISTKPINRFYVGHSYRLGSRAPCVFQRRLMSVTDYKGDHHGQPCYLDELPVPHGSWNKYYRAQQKRYNKHLVLGGLFFLFTVFQIKQNVFFNACIPPLPEDECPPREPEPKCKK